MPNIVNAFLMDNFVEWTVNAYNAWTNTQDKTSAKFSKEKDVNAQNQDVRKITVSVFKKELRVEFIAVAKTAKI